MKDSKIPTIKSITMIQGDYEKLGRTITKPVSVAKPNTNTSTPKK